ncbi:MAG: helicase HerA-like domain-containing protein [Candidatus Woesearchaeota archaeon]
MEQSNKTKLKSSQEIIKDDFSAFLGTSKNNKTFYPLKNLNKHFIALGSSGSGKTVLTKIMIEECALNKIPSIVIDLQGDLSSLCLMGKKEQIIQHNLSEEQYLKFKKEVEVVIFTPISTKGVPICINPLKLNSTKLPEDEVIPIMHSIATSISKLIGYNITNDKGKSAEAVLYTLLKYSYNNKEPLESFEHVANLLQNLDDELKQEISPYITDEKELQNLVKKLKFMGVGEKKLIFQMGVSLDIDLLLGKKTNTISNKTQISVIYLNTLPNQDEKEFFLSSLSTELYQWMLENPSDKLQCAYVIDEIAPFLPATSEKPMTKTILKLLFKQARKYGVGCLIATQNPGDIDYKAFAQFGSWAIGRLSVKQDVKKVESALKSLSNSQDLMEKLPQLSPGEFLLFAPDISTELIDLKARWLYTEHKTLNEYNIKELMKDVQTKYKPYFVKEIKSVISKSNLIHSNNNIDEDTEEKQQDIWVDEDTKKNTEKLEHCFISLNAKEAMNFAKRKQRKLFWLFGPKLEEILDIQQTWHPYIMTHVKAREYNFFGLIKGKLKNYILFFDGQTGNLVKCKKRKHKIYESVSKLLNLSDNQLLITKNVMLSRKPISLVELVHNTNLPQSTITKALNALVDLSIITFKKVANFKQWYSLTPFKAKKVNQVATKQNLITKCEVVIKKENSNIAIKDIAQFIRTWFKEAQLENKRTVYLPYYKITYVRKQKTRSIIVNGATKKVDKVLF